MLDETRIHNLPIVMILGRCFLVSDEEVLLIRRSKENCIWRPDQWEIPGGKFDSGDNISKCIEREVVEETGLKIKCPNGLAYVKTGNSIHPKYLGIPLIQIFYAVETAPDTKQKIKLSEEHTEYRWVNKNKVKDYISPDITILDALNYLGEEGII